jgi:hypothetical protein
MQKHKTKFLIILFASLAIKVLSFNIGFFWDSVLLGSRVADFFHESGFGSWQLPVEMDSGHPPLFGYLLGFWWKIFGQTLASSHIFMMPFVFGVLWQLHLTAAYFFEKNSDRIFAMILVLADPTLSSQMVLINPDLPQLFFFLLALNGLLKGKNLLLGLGLAFLGLASFRGMMLCAGIFAIDFAITVFVRKEGFKSFISKTRVLTYLVGFLPAIIYIAWRYFFIGWIVTSPLDLQGEGHYHIASVGTIFRNLVVIAHRFLDFGRIFLFIFVAGIIVRNIKNNCASKEYLKLALIFVLSTSVIWLTSIFINNPLGHRYFIPSYIALGLLAYKMLLSTKWPRVWFVLLTFALLSGNLWVYPERIAQGWDSSLAHTNYWPARQEALNYMNDNGISPAQTGTFFPNITSNHKIMLDGNHEKFLGFTGEEDYAFYSNVFNLTDEEFLLIEKKYTPIKQFKKTRVKIVLYQKRD